VALRGAGELEEDPTAVPEQRTRRVFGPFSLPLLSDGGCGGWAKVPMLGGRCLAARPHAMEELRESSGSRGFGRRRENGGVMEETAASDLPAKSSCRRVWRVFAGTGADGLRALGPRRARAACTPGEGRAPANASWAC
jgi:hypothetical protein